MTNEENKTSKRVSVSWNWIDNLEMSPTHVVLWATQETPSIAMQGTP